MIRFLTMRLAGATALALVLSPVFAATSAYAQDPGCAAYETFATPSATRAAAAGQYNTLVAQVILERVTAVTLQPIDTVQFVAPPSPPPGEGVFAGMVTFNVVIPGVYRVALSDDVPMVLLDTDGNSFPALADAGVSGCDGVAEITAFDLQPGYYIMQFAEKADADLTLAVTHVH